MELRQAALDALREPDPRAKAAAALRLQKQAAQLPLAEHAPPCPADLPGRPALPALVHPARVPKRSPNSPEGLAALLHAIAHIEFNAINLALDAAWRFEGMPRQFHLDWVRIAAEEAYHFGLLADLLHAMGHAYGDFDAHDGLWKMCEATSGDVLARVALVPRTLEARGLDATPQIQDKLRRVDSPHARRAVEVLDIILRDEIGHVAAGNRWYAWCCERVGLDPVAHYPGLVSQYRAPKLHPPFNEAARLQAGFSTAELQALSEGLPDAESIRRAAKPS